MLPRLFLFDNGSLRAAATLNLRRLAQRLSAVVGPVEAVSLLHSSAVPAVELEGVPARLLEPALVEALTDEETRPCLLLPLFFGPSAALTEYVPERLARLRERFPAADLRLAPPLCPQPSQAEPLLVDALARQAETALATWAEPASVVLVDHGSPQRGVAEVRDTLAAALAERLRGRCVGVFPASMERRPGPEYAFNEPLLLARLGAEPVSRHPVVVLLQFLSPGRHAGPEGDIAEICHQAEAAGPGLRWVMTETLGGEPEIVELLRRRLQAVL